MFLMVRKEEFTVCKLHVIIDTEYFSTQLVTFLVGFSGFALRKAPNG